MAVKNLAKAAATAVLIGFLAGGATAARAQDSAAQEAARRATVLAGLPRDAAKRVFGLVTSPASGPSRAIGTYAKGCIAGATALPADDPNWQVMRPSRNRAWGHPVLIAFLERLSVTAAAAAQWPGLLVGDIGQPRGGPMVTGHASHQIGLDADIWLTPMPDRRLTAAERDEMPARKFVAASGDDVRSNFVAAAAPQTARNRRQQPWRRAYFRQPGDQARALPGRRSGSRLAAAGSAVVGT